MKRIAMIKDGVVENISIWDGISEWAPEGYTLYDVSEMPEIVAGYGYDGVEFIPPDPEEAPIEAPVEQIIHEVAPEVVSEPAPKLGFWAKLFS